MAVCPEDRVTAFVAADPSTIWEMVSDITRMGEWSPECYKAIWLSLNPWMGDFVWSLTRFS
jgi:hypothetical protein